MYDDKERDIMNQDSTGKESELFSSESVVSESAVTEAVIDGTSYQGTAAPESSFMNQTAAEQEAASQNEKTYNVYEEDTNSYTWTPIGEEQPGFNQKQKKKKIKKEKKAGHTSKIAIIVVMALIFGVIAGGTMYGVNTGLSYIFPGKNSQVNIGTTNVLSDVSKQAGTDVSYSGVTATDVSAVVNETMPSVVAITTTQVIDYGSYLPFYNGGNSQEVESGSGSGIIIGKNDTELLIITSNHVVEDSNSVNVKFVNDSSVNATVKAAKAAEDLAIVSVPLASIDADTLGQIKIATLATEDVTVGEGAIAIGNALGYGQSVTTGVISAVNRDVTVDNMTLTLIQTDAAINPGNSGGALLNMKGEVIGINEAKYSSSGVEGMGFAIPISQKTDIINELVNTTTKDKVASDQKGYVGIYGRDVSSELSQMYNIPEGVYITQVIDGGAADKAGIEKSDVVVELDGESVGSMDDLQSLLDYYESGQTVKMKVMTLEKKEYVEKEIEITLTGELK